MLEIDSLRISAGDRQLVSIDRLVIEDGERLGVVGESGSGKTLTVLSVVGLLPESMEVSGSIRMDGQELLGSGEKTLAGIRGNVISTVFQDPGRSLNPTMRVGRQISEAIKLHSSIPRAERTRAVLELMRSVQLPDPAALAMRYPHELSGGQQQRVMIAIAIACRPKLLIADEPTTALDVTVQQSVLRLLVELCETTGMGLILVSHNLGVVQSICDRIVVMNSGAIVEVGPTDDVINRPSEAYTRSLIAANPVIDLATKPAT